ncbi:class I SAM-dependent methyltransferase [Saccharopolyspora griseoalba]|uniref:Class I SAM-dependent methyltransferase n=1 Tax=Saccharopolyspora griseoalba TaxID=1431848 RepID=A0ABW2LUQ7_9PSEU
MGRPANTGSREAFDAAAADFAALGRYLWEPVATDAVATADPGPGERVLDACCGTGASAIPSARLVGEEGLVDAVDVSAPMIAELRERASGIAQLRAHEADVTAWGGAGYDLVQSVLGIFFFPDVLDGTRRLIGMARPGGRVACTIWRRGAVVAAGEQLGLAIADVRRTDPPAERPAHLIDRINQPGPFAEWLRSLGLVEVRVAVHERALPMTPGVAWLLVLGSGYRGALTGLPPEVVAEVRDRYLARLREAGIDELDTTTLTGTGTAPV